MKFVFKFDKLKKKRCDIKKIKIRDMKHSKKNHLVYAKQKQESFFVGKKQ